MTIRELLEGYLRKKGMDSVEFTLIVCRFEKDTTTPFFHPVYETRAIERYDRQDPVSWGKEYVVLNHKQSPIDWLSGSGWSNSYHHGSLQCYLVTTMEELHKQYSKEQAEDIVEYCDGKIKEDLGL